MHSHICAPPHLSVSPMLPLIEVVSDSCGPSFSFLLLPILLTSFSLHLHFSKGSFFCMALVFCFFDWFGDEYFSWWYVHHVLTYGTGIGLYAFNRVFLICDCFCPLLLLFFLIWYSNIRPQQSMVPASPDFICHFFHESNTEGINFGIMFIYLTIVQCSCFVLYSTSVRIDLVKSPVRLTAKINK